MNKKYIFALSLMAFLLIFTHSCIDELSIYDIDRPPSEAVSERLLQDAKRMFYAFADTDGTVELRTGNNGNGNNGNGNNGNNGNGNNGNGNNGNNGNGNNGNSGNGNNGNNGNGNNGNGNGNNGNNGNGNNGNNGSGNNGNGNGNGNNRNLAVRPAWEYSRVEQNNRYQTFETVLLMENTFHFATSQTAEKIEATQNYEHALSKTSLIHRTHRKTGETVMFLMTIVPDLSYLERTKFDPFRKMSYLRRDNKFDGLIFFHDLNGEFVNGWRYHNGEIVGTMEVQDEAPKFELGTRLGWCWTEPIYVLEFWCWSTNWGGGGCYVREATVFVSICRESGFSGGGFGHNGGGFGGGLVPPPPPPPPYSDAPLASELFDVSDLTREEREAVEEMIREMVEDCLGEQLFTSLRSSGRMSIGFNSNARPSFNLNDRRITLRSMTNSGSLFHELFHAYQFLKVGNNIPNFMRAGLNFEIETLFAHFLYVRTMFPGSLREETWTNHPDFYPFAQLEWYVTPYGKLQPGESNDRLDSYIINDLRGTWQRMDPNTSLRYDFDRVGIDNFSNLQRLMQNCD